MKSVRERTGLAEGRAQAEFVCLFVNFLIVCLFVNFLNCSFVC